MAHLNETQRVEILILSGCGDKKRTERGMQFNKKYPDRPISQSTVRKIVRKFGKTGHVNHSKRWAS